MNKYPREAIMAVIGHHVESGFTPIDDRIAESGLDEYIRVVALQIGTEAADGFHFSADAPSEAIEAAAEVNFLHGVLFGVTLAEAEAVVEEAVVAAHAGALGQHFDREHLPPEGEFHEFAKQGVTKLARVNGPFSVATKEGLMTCPDGWLALDTDGDPYPVADEVFRKSYALAP